MHMMLGGYLHIYWLSHHQHINIQMQREAWMDMNALIGLTLSRGEGDKVKGGEGADTSLSLAPCERRLEISLAKFPPPPPTRLCNNIIRKRVTHCLSSLNYLFIRV